MHYWISCTKFTCRFTVDAQDRIIDAAPIISRFKGQNVQNLIKWVSKLDTKYLLESLDNVKGLS